MKKLFVTLGFILLINGIFQSARACTDFRLTGQDGTVLIARSLEFGLDLKSELLSAPRGTAISNTTPNGKSGMSWKAKYGSVFLDALGTGYAIDGLNEQGLSIESLYLPGLTQYQDIPAGQEKNAISYLHFGDWVLGNFKNVDEVKQALNSIHVYSQPMPQMNNVVFPLHYAIYDSTGKGIVVEFVGGKMSVYDNTLGIMTNSPIYSWHESNLDNYLHLSPYTPNPIIANGVTYIATGTGTGMLGLPGDVSPPSRFIKMAALLKTVLPVQNADALVNLAQHIMNTVDIPIGFVRQNTDKSAPPNELTQWVIFKDLTHKVFYYRTYNDLSLHSVDLAKVNFAENAPPLKMSIVSKQMVIDMTSTFLGGSKK